MCEPTFWPMIWWIVSRERDTTSSSESAPGKWRPSCTIVCGRLVETAVMGFVHKVEPTGSSKLYATLLSHRHSSSANARPAQ